MRIKKGGRDFGNISEVESTDSEINCILEIFTQFGLGLQQEIPKVHDQFFIQLINFYWC